MFNFQIITLNYLKIERENNKRKSSDITEKITNHWINFQSKQSPRIQIEPHIPSLFPVQSQNVVLY